MSEDPNQFHMLTCFNLSAACTIKQFSHVLDEFTLQMQQKNLLLGRQPIGQRQRHPIMDTDSERNHEYFFLMSFQNRAQCDAAVEYMMSQPGLNDEKHAAMLKCVADPIFICWQDLESQP